MARLKIIVLLSVLVALASCVAQKRAAEFEAQPGWLRKKPEIDGYYLGVGSAKKTGLPAEYIERARRDALADLAAEVSLQVSSTSVLHTIETEYGKTDYYNQHIEIIVDDYLEGFEPVDFYENEDTYWVLYRIGKNTYREVKEKRKKEAIANARAKLSAGKTAQQNQKPGEAIVFYLQGLSAVKAYLTEETPAEYLGQPVDVGNSLFASLNQVISEMDLKPLTDEIFIKRGQRPGQSLQFVVTYRKQPVKDIRVIFKYSGGYLANNIGFSDENGKVFADPGRIRSTKSSELLTASIDLSFLAQKATDDLFIRGLLTQQAAKTASIPINIQKPDFSITTNDNFCAAADCDDIIKLFKKHLLRRAYLFDTMPATDYRFGLNLKYSPGETAGKLTSVYLSGTLDVSDVKNNLLVWSKNIPAVKGVGKSREEAEKKAFSALLKKLDLIYFGQGIEAVDRN